MTQQMPNHVIYQNEKYDIVGVAGSGLVDARKMGIKSFILSSACWHGFRCTYAVENNQLWLVSMEVGENETLVIDGIAPDFSDEYRYKVYTGLHIEVPFTGGLVAGNDFIIEMYVHMGFQSPHTFKKVLEFKFDLGKVTSINDCSGRMADLRQRLDDERQAWEIAHRVEREEADRLTGELEALWKKIPESQIVAFNLGKPPNDETATIWAELKHEMETPAKRRLVLYEVLYGGSNHQTEWLIESFPPNYKFIMF